MTKFGPVSPLVLAMLACAAVYPEVSALVKAPPSGRELEPGPPADLVYITFERAEIPERTRDGRKWETIGGDAPDPFGKILVNDVEILRTPLASNTRKPTWPEQKRANYRIAPSDRVRVELWDSNPIHNHPICVKELPGFHDRVAKEPVEIRCESDARVVLRLEPAHARWGLGFFYELRTGGAAVTRVLTESPAARAGLAPGDDIVAIGAKKVRDMEDGELQSTMNTNGRAGVDLLIEDSKGKERRMTIKEGPIYPLSTETVPVE